MITAALLNFENSVSHIIVSVCKLDATIASESFKAFLNLYSTKSGASESARDFELSSWRMYRNCWA